MVLREGYVRSNQALNQINREQQRIQAENQKSAQIISSYEMGVGRKNEQG